MTKSCLFPSKDVFVRGESWGSWFAIIDAFLFAKIKRAHFCELCLYVMRERENRLLETFPERSDLFLLSKLIWSITDDLKWRTESDREAEIRLTYKYCSFWTVVDDWEISDVYPSN